MAQHVSRCARGVPGVCKGVQRVLSACADAGKAATGHMARAAEGRLDSHGITCCTSATHRSAIFIRELKKLPTHKSLDLFSSLTVDIGILGRDT